MAKTSHPAKKEHSRAKSGHAKVSAARQAGLKTLRQVFEGQSLSAVQRQVLDKLEDPRDRGLANEVVNGVLRWRWKLEFFISQLLSKPLKPKDIDVQLILLMALYELIECRTPDYAIINEAVELVRKSGKKWAASLVNAVLRRFTREKETMLAAIADDIAYNNHDLDDGLRAGLFTEAQIRELPIIGPCYDEVERLYPDLTGPRHTHEALRRVFGLMVEDVLTESQRLIANLDPKSVSDVRGAQEQIVRFSDPMFADLKIIRAFFFTNMYRHWKVRRMRRKAASIVKEMFEIFMDDPGMLPDDGWQKWAMNGDQAQKAHVISDYIAGMTDRYALQEYQKLTDPMSIR